MQTVDRYLETFERLRRARRWGTDSGVLRFAALSLALVDQDQLGERLEQTAAVLRSAGGLLRPLRSPVRHAVAALLLRRGIDAAEVTPQIERTIDDLAAIGVRQRGVHRALAALLLVLEAGGERPAEAWVRRTGEILERWNKDHPWLTGADDLPMAAFHAVRTEDVEHLGLRVERIYQALHRRGFRRGQSLQLASHLLAASDVDADGAVERFTRMATDLRQRGLRTWASTYDEVALLSLGEGETSEIAHRVLEVRERLRRAKPRPGAALAFSLATGLVLAEQLEFREEAGTESAASAATLRAVQSMIEAQQAAMIAVISASTAAAASAAASS